MILGVMVGMAAESPVGTLLDRESRTLLETVSWSSRKTACGWKCGCPSPNPPQACSRQPEPVKGAYGVTRDRLRRPDRTRLPSGSAAAGFGEGPRIG